MLSVGTWIVICAIILVVKYGFMIPYEDSKLYSMYAVRDQVNFAAMKKEIVQDSDAYNYVIDHINFQLYYMKNDYDFSIIWKNIFTNPIKIREYVNSMYELINEYEILKSSYNYAKNKFIRSLQVRLFIFNWLLIRPIYVILKFVYNCMLGVEKFIGIWKEKNILLKWTVTLSSKISIYNQMKSDYSGFRKNMINQ